MEKRSQPSNTENIRLNKFISNAGVCSRRDADKLIEKALIKVNGKTVTELGFKVSNKDIITYNDKELNTEKKVYFLLNKPKNTITTTKDPQGRRTVIDLITSQQVDVKIYPVGRLDRNTTGLLLLTNDGELAKKLAHPSGNVKKLYHVVLDIPLLEKDFNKIIAGIELEDGKLHVDDLSYIGDSKTELGIEIHSGKNRIIRRLFQSLGYTVIKLDRTIFAGLTKKELPRGSWRILTDQEIIHLKHFSS